MIAAGNLTADIARDVQAQHSKAEQITPLVTTPQLRIERIVSHAHASPADFWYDQDWAEWVLVVSGEAGLRIDGEPAPRRLRSGDHVLIPPHVRHRVEWTAAGEPTIWLAVHYP
jgi:cupin 2 domain-containing protein